MTNIAHPPPDDLSHYQHQDSRLNNPDAGSVRPDTDPDIGAEVAEWSREPPDPAVSATLLQERLLYYNQNRSEHRKAILT